MKLHISTVFSLACCCYLLPVDLPEHLEILSPLLVSALRAYLVIADGLLIFLTFVQGCLLEGKHIVFESSLFWAEILVIYLSIFHFHFLTLRILWHYQLPFAARWSYDLSFLEIKLDRRLVILQLFVLQLGNQDFLHS